MAGTAGRWPVWGIVHAKQPTGALAGDGGNGSLGFSVDMVLRVE